MYIIRRNSVLTAWPMLLALSLEGFRLSHQSPPGMGTAPILLLQHQVVSLSTGCAVCKGTIVLGQGLAREIPRTPRCTEDLI